MTKYFAFNLVKREYNYRRMLDVKGYQMKLNENRLQVRRQMPLGTDLGTQNGYQNRCHGSSQKHTMKTTQANQQIPKTQKKNTSVIIQRYVILINLK